MCVLQRLLGVPGMLQITATPNTTARTAFEPCPGASIAISPALALATSAGVVQKLVPEPSDIVGGQVHVELALRRVHGVHRLSPTIADDASVAPSPANLTATPCAAGTTFLSAPTAAATTLAATAHTAAAVAAAIALATTAHAAASLATATHLAAATRTATAHAAATALRKLVQYAHSIVVRQMQRVHCVRWLRRVLRAATSAVSTTTLAVSTTTLPGASVAITVATFDTTKPTTTHSASG